MKIGFAVLSFNRASAWSAYWWSILVQCMSIYWAVGVTMGLLPSAAHKWNTAEFSAAWWYFTRKRSFKRWSQDILLQHSVAWCKKIGSTELATNTEFFMRDSDYCVPYAQVCCFPSISFVSILCRSKNLNCNIITDVLNEIFDECLQSWRKQERLEISEMKRLPAGQIFSALSNKVRRSLIGSLLWVLYHAL